MSRYLTKSRFTLALTCPTKLAYQGDPRYVDNSKEDEFLEMLAEGGFQVGELTKAMFEDGIEIEDRSRDVQAARTREFLERDTVTLFEGTVIAGNWLVRADILRKSGGTIELIEVKAKSFDSVEAPPPTKWRNKDGSIGREFLPYLQDVAFQTLVIRSAFPHLTVKPFLMLPDKSRVATVEGLNRMFRIERTQQADGSWRSRAVPTEGMSQEQLGEPILDKVDVSVFVEEILGGMVKTPGGDMPFIDAARQWGEAFASGRRISPVIGPQCGKCQFRSDTPPPDKLSGFHECWGGPVDRPVVDLYHPNKGQVLKLMKAGRRSLGEIRDDELPSSEEAGGLKRADRKRLQVFGLTDGNPFHFDRTRWRTESAEFRWPLNFIDFEGARVAIPVSAGAGPYEQIAFQFSHHIMESDGSVRHENEFISLEPGVNPNVGFVRALRRALTEGRAAGGTVFMWYHYERTVLGSLRRQLEALAKTGDAPEDIEALLTFLEAFSAKDGPNAMVDLCEIAGRLFFHPDTEGSSSIKKVLPAVLKSSAWLKDRYSKPVYGPPDGIPSKNFPIDQSAGMVWWRDDGTGPANPYDLLPPVMDDLPVGWNDSVPSVDPDGDDATIEDGGAAMTAYLRMQFTDVVPATREVYRRALLRYCELDTLAMVMVFEAWREWSATSTER
jgi:hypothetical protein